MAQSVPQKSLQRHVVCSTDELATGEHRQVKLGGRRLLLCRLGDGSYRAVSDTCPHQGAALSDGRVEEMWVSGEAHTHETADSSVVVCPWHNFEFDLDTGRSPCGSKRLRVSTYPVEQEDGEIVVYL